MSYSFSYRKLFRIDIVHDYFLNSGEVAFDQLETGVREKIMKDYAFNSFLRIVPLPETLEILKNQKMMLRSDESGFEVIATYIPVEGTQPSSYIPFISISDSVELKFLVKIGDPYFENYTDLAINKNEIFYFSNVKPAGVTTGFQQIPLKDSGSPDITNSFRMTAAVTTELTKDLTQLDRIGLFGIISLKMHGDQADRYLTDANNKIFATPRTFELGFKNRSMFWRYQYGGTDFYAETNEELPLTKNGYIIIDPLQNLTIGNPDPDADFTQFQPEKYHYPGPDVANVIKPTPASYQSVIYI